MPRRPHSPDEGPPTGVRARKKWIDARKHDAERAYASALAAGYPREAAIFRHAAIELIENENPEFFNAIGRMKRMPVPIDEFMDSREFLGCDTDEPLMDFWPNLRPVIRAMNPDVFVGEKPVTQVLMGGATGWGKLMPVDTLIPTPTGFKTMGDMRDGDELFDELGKVCRVVKAHDVQNTPELVRFTFDDGTTSDSCVDHLWLTATRDERIKRAPGRVRTTREIVDTLKANKGKHNNHSIPVAEALDLPERALPIEPYAFGLWLGDGDKDRPTLTTVDNEIEDAWIAYGRSAGVGASVCSQLSRARQVRLSNGVGGGSNPVTNLLKDMGVRYNKHIPIAYLRASHGQRLALLQGLMDTDGYADPGTGSVELTTVSPRLADDAIQLIRSLGWKTTLRETRATLKGRDCGPKWRIQFMADQPVFRLDRKIANQCYPTRGTTRLRYIVKAEPIASRPGRCITVDSPSNLYLAGKELIVTHNTHSSLATMLYQVYLTTCFTNVHRLFGLNRATTPIVFMFMSVSGTVTKRVLYQPFRSAFTSMPYAKRWVTWDKHKESELALDNNVLIVPALASIQSMVGQAICGVVIDEINFMNIVENSKQVAGSIGQGGFYDQADIVWSNIVRRRKRSFTTQGVSIGVLCAPSSTRYKGDYIDRKMIEAEDNETVGVLPMRYRQYDIAPLRDADDLAGKTFRLLVGTDNYPTRVLNDDDEFPPNALIENVPISYRPFFLSDPEGAARDVLGVASHSITPFFAQRHKIVEAMIAFREAQHQSYIIKSDVVLAVDGMPQIDEELLPMDREAPRFVHVDLSSSIDCCGIAIVKYDGHTPIADPQHADRFDLLPKFVVEAAISIKPDSLHQIDAAEVRKWVQQLSTYHKLNIASVSYDGWQSKESLGLLRAAGITSQEISVDKTSDPYRTFRSALYEGRIKLPESDKLRLEMVSLEYLSEKDKIDHPPRGCHTGDTRIALANGSCPTFKELSEQYAPDEPFYVYTMGPEGMRIAPGFNSRITKRATELVEILLDNYQTIRCTPDHLYMTLEGEWVRAENLTSDISIMPLYRSRSNSGGWAGYERVWCPVREQRLMTHHLAYGTTVPAGYHVHHRDEVKHNNDPRNLELLDQATHCSQHSTGRWDSKRDAMAAGHAAYYTDPVKRQEQADRMRLTMADKWAQPKAKCLIEHCDALASAKGLCGAHYQKGRRAKASWSRTSQQKNHRVLSVTRVAADEDVYDITVPDTENFALADGVFVHNSKDCVDAVCGAIFAGARSRIVRSQNVSVNQGGAPQYQASKTNRRDVARSAGVRRA